VSKLECLAIKGNYFVEKNPDYRALLIKEFTALKEIDGVTINTADRVNELPDGAELKQRLLCFVWKLD
jgi:hypothetical protein